MDLRRILALLLLTSLAFELASAGRGHSQDPRYHRRRPNHGKAKGLYKAKPSSPIYVPPVVVVDPHASMPPPALSPYAIPPNPILPHKEPEEPSAPPPSYDNDVPATPPPSSPISIRGVVLCQNCNYVGTSYYSYAKALPGAVVKLACKSASDVQAQTEASGTFYLQAPNYVSVVEDCKVYLVSSPQSTCNTPTDINGGVTGSPIQLQKNSEGEDQYTSGPLVFAPEYCRPTPPPLDNSPPKPS
ncbi:hypothetical protein L7F22_014235, partial [Adiantum nelumboides]|nr:hypothetical protein [Adiantum nelumboides]